MTTLAHNKIDGVNVLRLTGNLDHDGVDAIKSRFVSQALIVGDRRPYVTALITLDADEVRAAGRDPQELVQELVDDVNHDRVRVEQIKRFAILPRDFSAADGELTPTLKLKRRVCEEHFAAEIEALYS